MCGRNSPPGQDLEEHKHVSCHARPAVRQEVLLPSWKEENAVQTSPRICQKHRCKLSREADYHSNSTAMGFKEPTHLSNICRITRKHRAMGIVAHRSWGLGNTFPSWSFRSAQPWPSGNQIQSAHNCSFSQDNILTDKTDNNVFFLIPWKEIKWHQRGVLSALCFSQIFLLINFPGLLSRDNILTGKRRKGGQRGASIDRR